MAAHRTLTQDQINQMQELMDLGMTRNQARYRVLTSEERTRLKQSNAAAALARKAADPCKALIAATRTAFKVRARANGLPRPGPHLFTITETDVEWPSHCPITGVYLTYHTNTDDAATLCRIDQGLGFIPGNVVVASAWVARTRGDASIPLLRRIVEFFEETGRPSHAWCDGPSAPLGGPLPSGGTLDVGD